MGLFHNQLDMIRNQIMKENTDTNTEEKSEAERFIDFTRKIMSVPKEEIDEQQKIYDREKLKRKKQAAKKLK